MAEMTLDQQRALALASARLRANQAAPPTEQQPVEQASAPATATDRIKALQGGLYTGAANILGLPMDTVQNAYNLAKAGVGVIGRETGMLDADQMPQPTTGTPFSSDWFKRGLETVGVNTVNPKPNDTLSKMLHTGGSIAGASMFPGATPSSVIAPAVGGAVAEQIDPRLTPFGAMAPAAAGQALGAAKNVVAKRAAPVVDTFKKVGATPSVGQATDSTFISGLENLAAKFPGGSGVMKNFIEAQQRSMGNVARTGVPAEAAGRAIESGVSGKGGFLDRTKAVWSTLDDAVAAKIPKEAAFNPANTMQALDDLTRPVAGAERSTGAPLDARISVIKQNLMDDLAANGGAMPFEALRTIRSRVGAQIDDALVQGAKSGEMSKLYGALSKDMKVAAEQAGAGNEFARQNNYYRARMGRIENVLDRVIGKGKQPEDIFKSVNPTDPDQANKLRAVMRSLSIPERQVVSEAVANRLGRVSPGKQNEVGDVFSSETFLTNWTRLSPGAKAQLFPNPPLRENLDRLAKASDSLRAGKGIYANPSGTAGSFAAYSVYASPIASIATGTIAPLAVAGGAAGTAYVGAKMLTNPKIVEWLATPVKPSNANQIAAHLARLTTIYNQSDEATKKELSAYVDSLKNQESELVRKIPK